MAFHVDAKGRQAEGNRDRPYPAISLSDAREIATGYRTTITKGGDPSAERGKDTVKTFADCAAELIATKSREWTNAKHRYNWEQTLGDSYCKAIRNRPVNTADRTHPKR